MRSILTKSGHSIIVDQEDYDVLVKVGGWYVDKRGYAITDKRISGKRTVIDMHRFIHPPKPGFVVDHINQNKLDNRKSNLRDATKSVNALNSKIPTSNTSGVKGASWSKVAKKWRSAIWLNGRQIHLGYYKTVEEAGEAYRTKLTEVF